MNFDINQYLKQIKLPEPQSHKGQNGKLLIIGGSDLFHAASKWSLDIASKFVDMVFYSSVPSNNQLVHEAKQNFWNGIVVERENLTEYLEEADCVLIGPGMTRQNFHAQSLKNLGGQARLTKNDWQNNTYKITNYLLKKYPHKRWVLDAGALQMVDVNLLPENCILTPHKKEFLRFEKILDNKYLILLKGPIDKIYYQGQELEVSGGNAGMTKGGTGDVLAGLVAALYCQNNILTSAVVASYVNKKAGESLSWRVGPFFNASDLVNEVPKVFWKEINSN